MDQIEKDTNPLISVVIPTHNRADLLKRALLSALRQTYTPVEIVVIDDGSRDETPSMMSDFQKAYCRIRYIRHDSPKGPCQARNRGILEAKGKYISFLDDDDEYTDDRLEQLIACFEENPDWSLLCSDYLSITKKGTRRSHKPGLIPLKKILWINYAGQSVIAEKDKIQLAGGWDDSLTAAQDYDLWTRLIRMFGPGYRLGKVLYIYHQEHDQPRITATFSKRIQGYFDYYLKHKPWMSRRQRAYQLYRLMKLRGRRINFCRFLKMVPPRFYLMELNDFLINSTSFYKILNRIKRFFFK